MVQVYSTVVVRCVPCVVLWYVLSDTCTYSSTARVVAVAGVPGYK